MSTSNDIQGGRWDEFYRRKFNLKGGPNTPELATEIVPTIPLPFGAEDRFLLQDKLCMGLGSATGLAGQFPRIVLEMPIESNKIGIVEGMWLISGGSQVHLNVETDITPAVSTVGRTSTRDVRWGDQEISLPTMLIKTGSVPAFFASPVLQFGSGDDRAFIPLDIVLWPPPGKGAFLIVEGRSAGGAINVSFLWRETVVEPSADA